MKTEKWTLIEKILNSAFSYGAAVVILAALAKILHWQYSDIFLAVGMLTEVGIFFTMGFIEMVKPKELVETTQPSRSTPTTYNQDLPHVDLTNELIQFRVNLERLNKMMGNILNSNK